MDLSEFTLDDDTKVKILALHEASILGLKTKNADLIQREKDAKLALETEKLATAQASEDQKVALAEKDGDITKYKLAVEERDAAMSALKLDIAEKNKEALMATAVSDFSAKLTDDPAGRMYMQSLFKGGVDVVEGVVKPKDVKKTLDQLVESFVSDKANANYIKVNVGSGGGAAGSGANNGNGTAKALKDMTERERIELKQRDPVLFNQLVNRGK